MPEENPARVPFWKCVSALPYKTVQSVQNPVSCLFSCTLFGSIFIGMGVVECGSYSRDDEHDIYMQYKGRPYRLSIDTIRTIVKPHSLCILPQQGLQLFSSNWFRLEVAHQRAQSTRAKE